MQELFQNPPLCWKLKIRTLYPLFAIWSPNFQKLQIDLKIFKNYKFIPKVSKVVITLSIFQDQIGSEFIHPCCITSVSSNIPFYSDFSPFIFVYFYSYYVLHIFSFLLNPKIKRKTSSNWVCRIELHSWYNKLMENSIWRRLLLLHIDLLFKNWSNLSQVFSLNIFVQHESFFGIHLNIFIEQSIFIEHTTSM